MRIISLILLNLFITPYLFAQQPDTLISSPDSSGISAQQSQSLVLKKKPSVMQPTMPQLPALTEKNRTIHFDLRSEYRARRPEEANNFDATNLPGHYKYESIYRDPVFKPNLPIMPLETPEPPFHRRLALKDYVVPTRQELDILEILWAKENVMDTTLYSCLDTTMNVLFEDLNKMLAKMTQKGLVSRRIVSPRNEFNLFGRLIEMNATNRRNRIFEYRSNVDRQLMRTFVEANSYLFSEDSSIVNLKQLQAARKDSTLFDDLNVKLHQPLSK
ncbi:MAG TPA: hypothetical protein ENN22_07780 [bacterium]|nr:hypothetical protein [bacterium]